MSLPSRLPYSPLLPDCDGADRLSDDVGRAGLDAGRLADGRLAGRRAAGRDRGAVDLGRDEVERGRDGVDLEPVPEPESELLALVPGLAALDAVLRDLVELFRAAVAREPEAAVDAVLRLVVVLEVAATLRTGAAAAGFAADIFLAASVRALAAVIMALVAVFIDCMADDIVFADAVALVAADVILVAADVTLVAADETFLAAVADVAELPLAMLRRAVLRPAVLRLAVLRPAVPRRAAVERVAVERDAVDRDAEPPVDREAVPRAVGVVDEPRADLVVVPRVVLDDALDDLELELGCDRLAVPLDALRLTDLLRAVLAGLRRVAARVVD
jgi:hypothetical protein